MSRRRERDDREMTGANTTPLANDRRDKPKGGSSGGLSLLNPSYLALGKGDSPGGDKKAITMGGEVFYKLNTYQQFNNNFLVQELPSENHGWCWANIQPGQAQHAR